MKANLKPVPKPCAKKIYEHMENYLYKINEKEGNCEIGYFIRLKDEKDKSYLALVTSPNVLKDIDSNSLKLTLDHEPKSLELGDIRYEDKKYGKAVIEIKESSDIEYFFEIDEDIFANEEERNMKFNKESMYIIQYVNKDNISVSYGIINNIYGKEIKYSANTNKNIKDNIILNLNNNRLICINNCDSKDYNNGIFIGDLIDQFRKIEHISTPCSESENNYTSISITINIDENEINKEIYFLDNYYYDDNLIKIVQHDHLKELNEDNTELYINGNKRKYEKYFIPEKEGLYNILLKFNINMKDCSFMFYGCYSLNSLPDISKWDTSNVKNMSDMFNGCSSLNSLPNISNWNTANVTDMSFMFDGCSKLKKIPSKFKK